MQQQCLIPKKVTLCSAFYLWKLSPNSNVHDKIWNFTIETFTKVLPLSLRHAENRIRCYDLVWIPSCRWLEPKPLRPSKKWTTKQHELEGKAREWIEWVQSSVEVAVKACDLKGLGLLFFFKAKRTKTMLSFSDMYQTIGIPNVTRVKKTLIVWMLNSAAVFSQKAPAALENQPTNSASAIYLCAYPFKNVSDWMQFSFTMYLHRPKKEA